MVVKANWRKLLGRNIELGPNESSELDRYWEVTFRELRMDVKRNWRKFLGWNKGRYWN